MMLLRLAILGWTMALFFTLGLATGQAGSTSTFTTISVGGDQFYNWDNLSTSCACSNNVDWPVTVIFRQNASVNSAKSAVGLSLVGSPMYHRGNDGAGWFWDSDSGLKAQFDRAGQPGRWDYYHMRFYAPPATDYYYNTSWRRYVLATTHIDVDEGWPSAQFGWSETTEEWFAARLRSRGYSVSEDAYWLANNDSWPSGRWVSNHYYLNNGYATFVSIP